MPQNDHDADVLGSDLTTQIERDNGCKDRDLSGFDFESLTVLDPLTFRNCTLSKAKLRGDSLVGSRWEDCHFSDCEFVGTKLRDATFLRCSLFDANTTVGTAFRFSDLFRAKFVECNLSLAIFLRCDAFEIIFRDCMMRGAAFDATTFQNKIGKKNFSKATFERCRLTDATLSRLDLTNGQFVDSSLIDANLSQSRFVNAELRECDLSGADLEGADFSGADLRKSTLAGFSLVEVAGYVSMQVSAGEQHHLLSSLGIQVSPDD